MSRLGCTSVTFEDYLRRRDPFSSRFREVVITNDCNLSFIDICNVLLRWHGELGVYLSWIAKNYKSFETEDGTLFKISVPRASLNDNEQIWLRNYLDVIFADIPIFQIEKISGWYGISDGLIRLTISLAPLIDCSLDIESKDGDSCEVFIGANARYHYFVSGDEIKEEIDASFYGDLKVAFEEFSKTHQDLSFEDGDPIFIPNDEFYQRE